MPNERRTRSGGQGVGGGDAGRLSGVRPAPQRHSIPLDPAAEIAFQKTNRALGRPVDLDLLFAACDALLSPPDEGEDDREREVADLEDRVYELTQKLRRTRDDLKSLQQTLDPD